VGLLCALSHFRMECMLNLYVRINLGTVIIILLTLLLCAVIVNHLTMIPILVAINGFDELYAILNTKTKIRNGKYKHIISDKREFHLLYEIGPSPLHLDLRLFSMMIVSLLFTQSLILLMMHLDQPRGSIWLSFDFFVIYCSTLF